ncbi:MAG TPA: VWA domain-containing protein [Chitinophagales bacterium]|nr:VWA domain-containing protein [Chitinophagales bacterium]HRK26456.1 VWA domain-containing protein [Chitinophagales bacterium]
MARKEINIFNLSMLDLLSGALGAILIIFVIIPKLSGDIKIALKELEQIKELKVDAQEIEKMIQNLKQSVPAAELVKYQAKFDQLEAQSQKLNQTITNLQEEVKLLQDKLVTCDNQRTELQEKVSKLQKEVEDLKKRLESNDTIVKQLEKQIEDLRNQLAKCDVEKTQVKNELTQKTTEVEQLKTEVEKLKEQLKNAKETIEKQQKEITEYKERVGVEYSGKNIVYVIDRSGSMDDAPEPQKMDEVKAGIKMMIANLDNTYKVDVVVFPKTKDEHYYFKYGKLTPISTGSKYDIYKFVNEIKAYGCTPSRQSLEFALTSPSYADASTIVFVSDGAPTKMNGNECVDEDINDVLAFIKSINSRKITINCLGVGSEFRNQASTSKEVVFMKELAKQNSGFYIGF